MSATRAVTVESFMTADVFVVKTDMTVRTAIELMTGKKIGGAPIVDAQNRLISVISEGDLLKLAASVGLEMTIEKCLPRLPKAEKLICLKRMDDFLAAYRLFLTHPVHRIIVADDRGKLQGIVSRSNVLRLLVELAEKGETPKQPIKESASGIANNDKEFDVVAANVVKISPEDSRHRK
jgi:predicted transcriptional regulator